MAGSCRYGSACRNSHVQAVCSYFAAGNCRRGQQCDFKHEDKRNNFQENKVTNNRDRFPAPKTENKKSGLRFLRVPSTQDNLSNKFRFSVPSPSPYSDQIFYSSDSDWDECVEGEGRLDSCTLALYTCNKCDEQVLAQEGEERITCPQCEKLKLNQEVHNEKEPVFEEPEIERIVKKKKKRKTKLPNSVPVRMKEEEVYQTPEGVKVYRVKEELLKAEKFVDEKDEEARLDNSPIDTPREVDSGSEYDPEPVLNMDDIHFDHHFDHQSNEQGESVKTKSEVDKEVPSASNAANPKDSKPSPKSGDENYFEPNQNTQKSQSCTANTKTSSKSASVPKKSRNKTQRRRTKRQFQKPDSPHPPEPDTYDTDSTSSSWPVSLTICLELLRFISSFCLLAIIWVSDVLLHLFCLCLAVILFVLRFVIVLMFSLLVITYQFLVKMMHPLCFYCLHPCLTSLPAKTWSAWQQVFRQRLGYALPIIEVDRCKGKVVREQFTSTGARIHFLAGVRCEEEKEVENHFTLGLEVEPGNGRLLSGRARARYNQQKLCLALEDLARLEKSTVHDMVVGAKCYLGLGMFDKAKDILKFVKNREEVNPFEVSEIENQLVMEETLANLPDLSQVFLLRGLVEQQTACTMRYKMRLAELTQDTDMMKELVGKMTGGQGEQMSYCNYLSGLLHYYSGSLASAEQTLLGCQPPARVARARYVAQLANTARERLDLANHYVHWGRLDKGEEMFKQAVEIDLNNQGLEYLSRLGLAKCSLARGDLATSLILCLELLNCKLDMEVKVKVMVVKAEVFFQLGRYRDVITLVLGVPCYMNTKELASLLNKARQELGKVKVKTDSENYYGLLGLDASAGEAEIKTAFKRLARENHPDKFVDEVAKARQEEVMKNINQAYSTLSDDMSRAEYDSRGNKEGFSDPNMKEEMVKVFQEFFDEVQAVANDWAQSQAEKGRKVNRKILNLYISDYLLNNKEYFQAKYNLPPEVFQAFSENFKSSGSGGGAGGTRRNRRRR